MLAWEGTGLFSRQHEFCLQMLLAQHGANQPSSHVRPLISTALLSQVGILEILFPALFLAPNFLSGSHPPPNPDGHFAISWWYCDSAAYSSQPIEPGQIPVLCLHGFGWNH